jgi:hypothetical protein
MSSLKRLHPIQIEEAEPGVQWYIWTTQWNDPLLGHKQGLETADPQYGTPYRDLEPSLQRWIWKREVVWAWYVHNDWLRLVFRFQDLDDQIHYTLMFG